MSTIKILNSYLDWDDWIRQIRGSTTNNGVWDYVNPDLQKPIGQNQSTTKTLKTVTKPAYPRPGTISQNPIREWTDGEKLEYQVKMNEFKYENAKYEKVSTGFQSVHAKITNTVAEQHQHLIEEHSPFEIYGILTSLKQKLQPSKTTQLTRINREWNQLCRGPPRGKRVLDWINQFAEVYSKTQRLGASKFSGTTFGPFDEFYHCVRTVITDGYSGSAHILDARDFAAGKTVSFNSCVAQMAEKYIQLEEDDKAKPEGRNCGYGAFNGEQDEGNEGKENQDK